MEGEGPLLKDALNWGQTRAEGGGTQGVAGGPRKGLCKHDMLSEAQDDEKKRQEKLHSNVFKD